MAAPYATFEQALISYRHDNTAADIRGIRFWASWQHKENPNIEFEEFDMKRLWADMGSNCDPWGNPYQTVDRDTRGIYDMPSSFHVYSFGADGKSDSNGNDPDDINSWNYDRRKFYGRMIANDLLRKNLWRTLWITPITFSVIWLTVHTFKLPRQRRQITMR